jgi:hypothetical protein
MRDEDWGEVEAAFFRAGETHGQQPEGVVFDAEDVAVLGLQAPAPDRFSALAAWAGELRATFRGDPLSRVPTLAATARSKVAVLYKRAQRALLWHGRLVHFRFAVALFGGAEHALRAAASCAFHPRRVLRRKWLARACIVVLVSSVSSYSAAAVLVASGAL